MPIFYFFIRSCILLKLSRDLFYNLGRIKFTGMLMKRYWHESLYSLVGIGSKFIGDDVGGVNFCRMEKCILSTHHILMH